LECCSVDQSHPLIWRATKELAEVLRTQDGLALSEGIIDRCIGRINVFFVAYFALIMPTGQLSLSLVEGDLQVFDLPQFYRVVIHPEEYVGHGAKLRVPDVHGGCLLWNQGISVRAIDSMYRGDSSIKFLLRVQLVAPASWVNVIRPAELQFRPGKTGRRKVPESGKVSAVNAVDENRQAISARAGNHLPRR
jgi:hypothetical protein